MTFLTRASFLALLLVAASACSSDGTATPDASSPPPPPADATPPPDDAPVDPPPPVGGALSSLRIVADTGDTWFGDGRPDTATVGLDSLPGHNAWWYAWSIFHPGTDLYGVEENVADAVVEPAPGDECTVPCDEIIPLLRRDGIPPLDDPTMVGPDEEAELAYLADTDLVFGVVTPEGPRAYPHNILWWHEITNENIGGYAYSVTFCPLTNSGVLYERNGFFDGEVTRLGTSGSLYNSNLVMWDQGTDSLWSQMRGESISGEAIGQRSPIGSLFEMTWEAWRGLHPDTLVMSDRTGHSRDYTRYPYGEFRDADEDTFRPTNPVKDPRFPGKDMVFGLFLGADLRGYVWPVMEAEVGGRRGLIEDELGGVPVAIVFDLDAHYVHAFQRPDGVASLSLTE